MNYKKLQQQCHEAAQAQNDLQAQALANKRLDFEIARLKNCGELKKAGIMFHPKSPYFAVCADVVVTTPGGQLQPHSHNIPSPKWIDPSSSSASKDTTHISTQPTASRQINKSQNEVCISHARQRRGILHVLARAQRPRQ